MLFVDTLKDYGERVAFYWQEDGKITYQELEQRVRILAQSMGETKKLVAIECTNEIESIIGYLAALYGQHPVILVGEGTLSNDNRIVSTFSPELIYCKNDLGDWNFLHNQSELCEYHKDLCTLLSTSGTTGSAKLVRLSRKNIQSNALAIAEYLDITAEHTAITTLPYHYSYGMSVINSHLAVGASIVLTNDSVADLIFWQLIEQYKVSSFAGVPYTFELLERQGFRKNAYPNLKYITQAGGRLPMPLVEKYQKWSQVTGSQFFIMYGQTEASPRIAYVPPEQLLSNGECIGKPISGGVIELLDEEGKTINDDNTEGELVYRGDNVMMGYASAKSELQLPSGERTLKTGDLAVRKSNGLYKIVGRMSRFSKLFGLRINLDEVEAEVHQLGISSVVVGNDDFIAIAVLQKCNEEQVQNHLAIKYKLNLDSFSVLTFDEYPLLPSGKIDQRSILAVAQEQVEANTAHNSLLEAYQKVMNNPDIVPSDSFVSIGGDSLFFVIVSIAIEEYLGFLPENWEGTSICELEVLKQGYTDSQAEIPRRKAIYAFGLICILLMLGEVFLQARVYLKTGRSALALLSNQSTTVFNEQIGVTTYRPNLVVNDVKTDMPTMEINAEGLRSAPIPAIKNDTRIAILGASTVAGAYAKNNTKTFPSIFNQLLNKERKSSNNFHVINAGIEGHTLKHTKKLFDGHISKLNPDFVMLYPRFNDITLLCRAQSEKQKPNYDGLAYPALPTWVLTREMISKNTIPLRTSDIEKLDTLKSQDVEPNEYGERVKGIIESIKDQGMVPALITVSRSYRNIPLAKAKPLAQESLYYYSCLNADGLIAIGDLYNEQIRKIALETNTVLFDLAKTMPGGREYFVDGGHFTYQGELFVAGFLFAQFNEMLNAVVKQ